MTLALLAMATVMVLQSTHDALGGAIIGAVTGYWLPTRPNRQPPT